jgi:hypothetical protein
MPRFPRLLASALELEPLDVLMLKLWMLHVVNSFVILSVLRLARIGHSPGIQSCITGIYVWRPSWHKLGISAGARNA